MESDTVSLKTTLTSNILNAMLWSFAKKQHLHDEIFMKNCYLDMTHAEDGVVCVSLDLKFEITEADLLLLVEKALG